MLVVSEEKEDSGDIWMLLEEQPPKEANYHSWDVFNDQNSEEPRTAYITESGSMLFDTTVASEDDLLHTGNVGCPIVDSQIYASSLLALGLGRSSVLFAWVDEKQSFEPILPRMRISGYTTASLNELVVIFMECGNITRSLQNFVDKSYAQNKSTGKIALADAVSTLLTTIQSWLSASASAHKSLLQLQALFLPAQSILTCFQRIVQNVSTAKTDAAMLSTIFENIQLLEHRRDSLGDILLEILCRVSRPWLEFSGEWLGLQRESGLPLTKEGNGKNFVKVENSQEINEQGLELRESDYALNYDMVPSFIPPEVAKSMFEVGRSLQFLREHHTDHPLARADIVASANPPLLEWKFSWQAIVEVESKALQYEKDLMTAIRRYSSDASQHKYPTLTNESSITAAFELDFFGKPEEAMQAQVLASIDTFDQPLKNNLTPDRLSKILNTYLSSDSKLTQNNNSVFAPPISLTPLLSFNPIIAAQARIVNGTCMRLFFNSHRVREHLSLQRNFQLMGNGVFSSRLSHALFDPELESAERHRGAARTGGVMGLRLGGRDTWPPASSELRLALMGVLTESYVSSQLPKQSHNSSYLEQQTSLPGELSFAVRDMSPEEIEDCMNPDSIEALDFLRLSYKPPPPLEAIITPTILYKYDQLFKFLLRIVRMLYVVSALCRDATDRVSNWQGINYIGQRFRIEAHHFISSVCGYFFDTGIDVTWRIFEHKLDEIEERFNSDDTNITLGQNDGLDRMRDYHERVVDRILFTLLLRKRQQPVMKLLEEIFTLILQFAKHSRESALGMKSKVGADDEVRNMYLRFRKKVGVFIAVCKGLTEKKGYGEKKFLDTKMSGQGGLFDDHDLAEENTIGQLLARLEMSNYYSKVVNV